VYEHYPIVRWAIQDSSWGKIAQNFNTSNYGNWWIPISIILKSNLPGTIEVWLTPREPYNKIDYITKDDWVMIDIRQAGNYLSRLLLYTYVIILQIMNTSLLSFILYL